MPEKIPQPEEIKELKLQLKEAKRVIKSVKYQKNKFDALSSSIQKQLELSESKKSEIESYKVNSEELLKIIEEKIAESESKLTAINSFYEIFEVSKAKIEDKDEGLEAVLEKTKSIYLDLESRRKEIEILLQQIASDLSRVQKNVEIIQTTYEKFLQTKERIDNPKTGLEATLANSQKLHNDIGGINKLANKLHSEIQKFRDDAKEFSQNITDLKTKSQTEFDEILNLKVEGEKIKSGIEQIYQLATDSGLANFFSRRKKGLNKAVSIWGAIFVLSIIGLFVALLFLNWGIILSVNNGAHFEVGVLLYRLGLTSPLIILVGFSATQYSHERGLLEKYAFKETMAASLNSYTSLFKNSFDVAKNEKEILTFVLDTFRNIFKEPYIREKNTKMKIGFGNKFFELNGEFAEQTQEVVEKVMGDFKKIAQIDKLTRRSENDKKNRENTAS